MTSLYSPHHAQGIIRRHPCKGMPSLFCAQAGERVGKEVGARARDKDGVVYLFSVPEDKVKHYDSDTVSELTNLAKCKISEQALRAFLWRTLMSNLILSPCFTRLKRRSLTSSLASSLAT